MKKQRRIEDKTIEHTQSDSVLHEPATEAMNIMRNTISLENLSTKENFTEKCLLTSSNANIRQSNLYEERAEERTIDLHEEILNNLDKIAQTDDQKEIEYVPNISN